MRKLQAAQVEKQTIQEKASDLQRRLTQAEFEKREFEHLQLRLEKDKSNLKKTLDSVRVQLTKHDDRIKMNL